MPHFAKPFHRPKRGMWYVQVDGTERKLAADRDEAFRLYHELMARPPETPAPIGKGGLVVAILDAFLDWAKNNREPRTFDWYRERLQIVAESLPPGLTVGELKPHHVTAVMDAKERSNNGKHNLARAIQRAFSWALKQEMVERNPVAHVEKPGMEARDLAVSPADYELVMSMVADESFRTLIRFAWESGVRPQEIRAIEARHVDLGQRRIVFPRKESKGKKSQRVVYLTDEGIAILRPLLKSGHVFLNSRGRPWTADAMNCAFCRLQYQLGRIELEKSGQLPPRPKLPKKAAVGAERFKEARAHYKEELKAWEADVLRLAQERGQKFHMGAFRKGYTTEGLKNGVDTVSLAHLLGHKDAVMVSRVYAKVQQDPAFMAAMAQRAKGSSPASGTSA